ncbi:hypothetical protein P4L24_25345 [Bacillus cereus]|nr:hypothetical protein [Bacillus cereus]
MITVKCFYENGDTVTTQINCTFEQAKEYYVGKIFNLGSITDNLQKCIKVKLLTQKEIELKTLASKMIDEYREIGKFSKNNLDEIWSLSFSQKNEIAQLIYKFHYINTKIADNGGMPVLKEIYNAI